MALAWLPGLHRECGSSQPQGRGHQFPLLQQTATRPPRTDTNHPDTGAPAITAVEAAKRSENCRKTGPPRARGERAFKQWAGAENNFGLVGGWADRLLIWAPSWGFCKFCPLLPARRCSGIPVGKGTGAEGRKQILCSLTQNAFRIPIPPLTFQHLHSPFILFITDRGNGYP